MTIGYNRPFENHDINICTRKEILVEVRAWDMMFNITDALQIIFLIAIIVHACVKPFLAGLRGD
ncbi:MAG: hypothetical protein JW838_15770 [Spirochaetes bacterium]|nr:hypothetical protein [Spirochaetota bacterium]